MFNLFKKKAEDFFTIQQKQAITTAIKQVEEKTSGEVRVFIESKCRFVNPIDRAKELFELLDMQKTEERNAVIVYIALKDRQMAIYADVGINQKVGNKFWNSQLQLMKTLFGKEEYVQGIIEVILQIGEALYEFFPYKKNDINELPNDIVFGN